MLFLQERGLLGAFVKRALSLQREDSTAGRALRETLGEKRWGTLDADFAPWARKLVF
jgi:hypothetical protein